MKWIFLTLVALNVVAFLYFYGQVPPEPTEIRPTDPGVEPLVLLEERPDLAGHRPAPAIEQPELAPGDEDEPRPVCFTVGPMDGPTEAEKLAEELAAYGASSEIYTIENREEVGFQVYLPPYESRAEAETATGELRDRGVEDFFIIGEGERTNAISLGLFSTRGRAERVRARFEDMGYEPELHVRYQTTLAYWLDYETEENGAVDDAAWEKAAASLEGVQRMSASCD